MKGNEDNNETRLRGYSCMRKLSQDEMDLVEMAVYGGVKKGSLECKNWSVIDAFREIAKSTVTKLPNCEM
jgi:hypothetical protein